MSNNLLKRLAEADKKLHEEARRVARALTEREHQGIVKLKGDFEPPPYLDYSQHVTLIGEQHGGGCGVHAALTVLDILKNRERKYSPTLSYRFLEYYYNLNIGLNQLDVLRDKGCCPEASLPSNYDCDPLQTPSADNISEAELYRIADYSDWISIGGLSDPIYMLKLLLWIHGPLYTAVTVDIGHKERDGHILALVGYSDPRQSFKIVNSWGDTWRDHGFLEVPYMYVTERIPQYPIWFDSIRWVNNAPTRPDAHPFTGTIAIQHTSGRRHLTIRVGAEGSESVTVWDRPNKADASKGLRLTFPLPKYAQLHWPPNDKNVWFVDVSQDAGSGVVQELVLVRRRIESQQQWFYDEFTPSAVSIPLLEPAEHIFIPTKREYVATLTASPSSLKLGQYVLLNLTLLFRLRVSDKSILDRPGACCPFKLLRREWDPESSDWGNEQELWAAQTGTDGKWTTSLQAYNQSTYRVVIQGPLGNVLAESNSAEVSIG